MFFLLSYNYAVGTVDAYSVWLWVLERRLEADSSVVCSSGDVSANVTHQLPLGCQWYKIQPKIIMSTLVPYDVLSQAIITTVAGVCWILHVLFAGINQN